MAEELTAQEMKMVLAAIFKRTQTDAEFRALCLDNPEKAIFEITGKRLPANSSLRFEEAEGQKKN